MKDEKLGFVSYLVFIFLYKRCAYPEYQAMEVDTFLFKRGFSFHTEAVLVNPEPPSYSRRKSLLPLSSILLSHSETHQ